LTANQISVGKVAAVFISGVIINQVSDSFELSSGLLFVTAIVVLVAMVALESGGRLAGYSAGMLREALAFLLLGGAIGGLWLIPIFPSIILETPAPFQDTSAVFLGAELGAALSIAFLATVAFVRKQTVVRVAIFLIAAVTGMSLAFQMRAPMLHPELIPSFSLMWTFVGWLIVTSAITLVAGAGRSIVGMYANFLRIEVDDRPTPSEPPARE
jgi:uncharacterized membrane protein